MFVYRPEPLRLGLFDLGGVLYHANYFALFEQAREALLREAGVPCWKLAEASQYLAISESHQSFLKPIAYGQEIAVQLRASKVRSASLVLHYDVVPAENDAEKLHSAWTKLAFIESVAGVLKPSKMPEEFRSIFERITD